MTSKMSDSWKKIPRTSLLFTGCGQGNGYAPALTVRYLRDAGFWWFDLDKESNGRRFVCEPMYLRKTSLKLLCVRFLVALGPRDHRARGH